MKRLYILLTAICILTSCWNAERFRCTWSDQQSFQFRLNSMKHHLDSASLKYLVYRPCNVKLSYLDCFREDTTAGRANFYYFDPVAHKSLSLSFCIRSNNEGWDVRRAIEYELALNSRKCIAEGPDYYVVSGNDMGGNFIRKTYLINNKWYDYRLFFDPYSARTIGKVIDLIKEWDPRIEQ